MKRKMFATVRRYERVTYPEAAAKLVDEIFVPLISVLPGFVEYFWIDLGHVRSDRMGRSLLLARYLLDEAGNLPTVTLQPSVTSKLNRVDA